jgi:NAD(P)-dependent dehydrogenase (short-subunit alcohol dehydrogenase family)
MSEAKMLDGKVCVVTGGGGAIGGEISKLMAAHGAKVIVNDLGGSVSGDGGDEQPARDVVAAIEDAGGTAMPHFGSVAERKDTEDMIKTAVDAYGQIDCIVNNAGILRDVIFHKMNEPDWDMVLQVHLKGSFNVARSVAPYFREQQSGSMIHFTSTSGLIGNFGQANYAAAKLGIVGLSKSVALDMGRFNVRSNCISPFAWSRMIGTIPSDTPEQKARLEKIQRMTPAQQAPLAVYLAADASKHVTGQIFGVRSNEIYLFSQPRPIRSVHNAEGWTPETIADHGMPTLESNFFELERSGDVFSWDPV